MPTSTCCLWRVACGGTRLESRALKYLEQHVLGLTRSSEEVPGYEIPWLYFDYLRTGDARPLAGVFYHNAMDVVAMAALLAHVNEMMQNPYEGRVEYGLDFIALGKLFEDLGHWEEAARLFERGLEFGLTESDFGVAVKRLSILQKRRGDFINGPLVEKHKNGPVTSYRDGKCCEHNVVMKMPEMDALCRSM
jgi:hypothetical protein